MMRALFVREERDELVIGAGLLARWFDETDRLAFGPTNTRWGPVSVALSLGPSGWTLSVGGQWFGSAPKVSIAITGFVATPVAGAAGEWRLTSDSVAVTR